MTIKIADVIYTAVRNIDFQSEADVTGNSVPVAQFSADIVTNTVLSTGDRVVLRDDASNLWAAYYLFDWFRLDDYTIRITAKSYLGLLDRFTMPAKMYVSVGAGDAIDEIFDNVPDVNYNIDSTYTTDPVPTYAVITGYAPEQSARDRLQWVLFCIGAMVKQSFVTRLNFVPVDSTMTLIPFEQTYWKPGVSVEDYVTSITVTAYTYVAGTPSTGEESVTVGGTTYIQTSQKFTLNNSSAPETTPVNVLDFENVTVVNQDNVSSILTRLASYYFNRGSVSAEILNNASFVPGQNVKLYIDEDTLVSGYIETMNATFGLQAKTGITISHTGYAGGAGTYSTAKLVLIGQYDGERISKQVIRLPLNSEYNIQNKYVDAWKGKTRRIYYPAHEYTTGTLDSATKTVNVTYYRAIEYVQAKKITKVFSVDSYTMSTESEKAVLTIS